VSLGELWRPIKTDSRCSLRMEFRMNWSAETEKAVVGKACAGDLSAFGLLYDNYSQNVYSRCLRFTKDPDTAEDLRQDVFIQAWKKISHFRGDSRFGTWLHRVTTNMIFMHFRKKKRHHPEENQISRRVKDQWVFEELVSSGPPQLDSPAAHPGGFGPSSRISRRINAA
jgi:RNA polymerase sigma factor (sigma-70 family)